MYHPIHIADVSVMLTERTGRHYVDVQHADQTILLIGPLTASAALEMQNRLNFDLEFTRCQCGKLAKFVTGIKAEDYQAVIEGWCGEVGVSSVSIRFIKALTTEITDFGRDHTVTFPVGLRLSPVTLNQNGDAVAGIAADDPVIIPSGYFEVEA